MLVHSSHVWLSLAGLITFISCAFGKILTGPELGIKAPAGTTFKVSLNGKEAVATVAGSGTLTTQCNWSTDRGWMTFSLNSNDNALKAASVRFFFAIPGNREKVEIATVEGDTTGLPRFNPAASGFKAAVSTAALSFLNEKATIIKGEKMI